MSLVGAPARAAEPGVPPRRADLAHTAAAQAEVASVVVAQVLHVISVEWLRLGDALRAIGGEAQLAVSGQ
ncbi:hypothetical protein QN357_02995 [Cryobacterium sp. RTC2.1]|uniref:hypothetical protein n=1 Tax=Cryobacterium sp. RTC2.1 TaxID=3048634 RepID=UPI002B23CDCC|nr:hypothetical protein [Cryobacterium sp. RTC2.1]MEB0001903.1 hypothetical protein [Cryobacterium sp. RTC2.1]